MTPQVDIRGGTPVRVLAELPALERWLVQALRDWCDGPDGQARVWSDLAQRLGPSRGRAALHGFERTLAILLGCGRRRFCRHASGCPCAGLDEVLMAHFVAVAAGGAEEDALLMAMLLVPADQMWPLVTAARQLGLELERAPGGAVAAGSEPRPTHDGTPFATRH
jgi:hypothetical protein